MVRELVPLRIKIVRGDPTKGESKMKHPPGHDATMIDAHGIGMYYAKNSGLSFGDDFQYAVTALPPAMAQAYIDNAGGLVEVITEAQAESFFATELNEADEIINDPDRLEIIKVKLAAGKTLIAQEEKMIDPNDITPGIVKNPRKGFKNKCKNDTIVGLP